MNILPRHNFFYWLIVTIIALSLHACGFQLRGAITLSEDISPVFIEENSAFSLARELKSLLASNKIKVVKNAKQSKTQLVLLNEGKNRRVLSVDGNGRAREYLLTYSANFVIKTTQRKKSEIETAKQEAVTQGEVMPEKSAEKNQQDAITVTRTWVFDPNAVLAVSNEAEILYKDMRRDAARLILLKLSAYSKNKHFQKNSENKQ